MSEKWKSIGKGTVVGEKYQLMRELEPGGGGPVFAAVRKKTKKIVIIRFFSEAVIPNMKAFNRAMRNAKAAFDKRNEFVTIPFDYEFCEGVPYVVYSGAAIKTFHQILAGGKKFTRKETKKLGQMLLSPLSTLHKAGIFHLGLSPMSIHQKKSRIQAFDIGVLDFGVTQTRGHDYFTRLADDEQYRCIAAYTAPEQAEGNGEADHRTDLYAVGALVYRLLTGREVFEGSDCDEILEKVKSEKPAGLGEGDRDGELTVLRKEFLSCCLEKDPAKRFQSALEMRESFFNAMFEEDDSFPSTERKRIVKESGRSPMVFYKVSHDEADRMEASSEVPTKELSVEPIIRMANVAAAFKKSMPSSADNKDQDAKKEAGKEKPIDHRKKVSLPPPPTDRDMPSIPPPPPRTSMERILELAKIARETASAKAAASAASPSGLDDDALEKEEAPPEKKEVTPEKEEEAADRDEAAPEGEEKKEEPEEEEKEKEGEKEEKEEEKAAVDGEKPVEEQDRPKPSRREAATIPASSPEERASAPLEPQTAAPAPGKKEGKKTWIWILIIAIVLAAIAAVALVFIFKGGESGESKGEVHPETGRIAQEPDPPTEPEPGNEAKEEEAPSPEQESEPAQADPAGEEGGAAQEETGREAPTGTTPPAGGTSGKKTRKKGPTEDLEFID